MDLIVIIVNYGIPDHVLKNLDALIPEFKDLDLEAECWIIDNNSPDQSLEIIRDGIAQRKFGHLVKLFAHSLNGGFGAGNNVAIRKAWGLKQQPKYFYLLNPDALVCAGTVKKLVTHLAENKKVGVAGGGLLDTNGKLECGAFRLPSLRSTIEEHLGIGIFSRIWKNYCVSISPEPDNIMSVGWVAGASMMVTAEALKTAGLFDEEYFLYFEELDLCKRIIDSGFEVHYLPDAEVIHDSGASTGLHEEKVRLPRYWHHSRQRYLKKAFGAKGLLLHNVATIIAGSIGFIYRKIRFRPDQRSHYLKDIIRYNFGNDVKKVSKLVSIAEADMKFDATTIIARRPHYRLVENELYFMASKNPLLSFKNAEIKVWNLLANEISYSELVAKDDPEILDAAQGFVAEGFCDAFTEHNHGDDRRKILVIEPHSDDAALSIGATMWKRRHDTEFTLFTLGSTSNYTSYFSSTYGPLAVNEITTLRNHENKIYMRHLNGIHVPADEKEATLRYHDGDWTHDFLENHRVSVSAFNNHFGTSNERKNWAERIYEFVSRNPADEIWIPMGVGHHSDHGITRDASLDALSRIEFDNDATELFFYQDVPYDNQFTDHKHEIIKQLEADKAVIEHKPVEISSQFSEKLRLLNIFASQFKLKSIQQAVEKSAKPEYADGLYEHFWKITKLPISINPDHMFCGANYITSIKRNVQNWFSRSHGSKNIRLLLLMPSGQWKRHMGSLLSKFPDTNFEVIASPSSKAEITEYQHERLKYRIIDAGGKSWGKLMIKLLFTSGKPTIFIAGDKRYSVAGKLTKIWPHHDTIVTRTMEDFILSSEIESS